MRGVASPAFSRSCLKREPCVPGSHLQTHACVHAVMHTRHTRPQAHGRQDGEKSPHPRFSWTAPRPGHLHNLGGGAVPGDGEQSACLVVVLVFRCKEPERGSVPDRWSREAELAGMRLVTQACWRGGRHAPRAAWARARGLDCHAVLCLPSPGPGGENQPRSRVGGAGCPLLLLTRSGSSGKDCSPVDGRLDSLLHPSLHAVRSSGSVQASGREWE